MAHTPLPDAIDVIPWPDAAAQSRTWAVLCSRVGWLRGYLRHDGTARIPAPTDPAWPIFVDCDRAYRDAHKTVLSGEIDDLVEGRCVSTTAINGHDLMDRARRYLTKIPPAVQGSNGSAALMTTLRLLVSRFALDDEQLLQLANEYSDTCSPRWNDREIEHAIGSIRQKPS